jgi:hypothetical protein
MIEYGIKDSYNRIEYLTDKYNLTDEKLDIIGLKLSQLKSLQLAMNNLQLSFDSLAEELSIELNTPIWRVHNTFKNVYESITPQKGNLTVSIN